jgi:hypothetical protein
MKTLLGAAFGALMLAGPAMAATVSSPANQAPAGIEFANTVSTPYTYGNGASQTEPTFNYQDSVPVNASVNRASNSFAPVPAEDSTLRLVNQTGGGR